MSDEAQEIQHAAGQLLAEQYQKLRDAERALEEERRRSAPLREKLLDTELDLSRARDDLEEMTADRDRLQQILNSAVGWTEPVGQDEDRPVSVRTAIISNFDSILTLAGERTALKQDLATARHLLREAVEDGLRGSLETEIATFLGTDETDMGAGEPEDKSE